MPFYHIILTMKKLLLILALGIIFNGMFADCANAGVISAWKENSAIRKELKSAEKEIKNCFELQTRYSNAHDYEKLKEFYADKYRNADSFDKNTTFSIIKENYELYPNLKMAMKINSIDINGNFATVNVYEYAEAHGIQREDLELKGDLEAFAHTIYYFEKIDGKWLITAEQALEESNSILFGEAKYFDIKLTAPMIIPAGESYSSTLAVNNLPSQALLMGSITQSLATFPLKEDEQEAFRVLEDLELERILTANKDNVNEYNIATIGITRSQPMPSGGVKLYMSGLGFLMTRVNVIPKNTVYTPVVEDEKEND